MSTQVVSRMTRVVFKGGGVKGVCYVMFKGCLSASRILVHTHTYIPSVALEAMRVGCL